MNNSYFRYIGQKCPVCENSFGENDDIVVCPVCGTPHHRECYKKNGECGNTDKHNDGFRWTAETVPTTAEPTVNESQSAEQPPFANTQSEQGPFGNRPNPLSLFPPELADGVATEETATFVQMGAFKYIERFFHQKSNKKTWNWMAFIFMPYWFFYRKLYKVGSIFLALTIALNIGFGILPPVVKYTDDIMNIRDEIMTSDTTSQEDIAKMQENLETATKNNLTGLALTTVQSVLLLVLRIVAGIYANKWYYEHTVKRIREIKAETPELARQRMLIFKKGGMSVSAPILAFMVSGCVAMIFSLLLQ